MHYNGYSSIDLTGGPAPGCASGQATAAIERLLRRETLPASMTFEWTDLIFQGKC